MVSPLLKQELPYPFEHSWQSLCTLLDQAPSRRLWKQFLWETAEATFTTAQWRVLQHKLSAWPARLREMPQEWLLEWFYNGPDRLPETWGLCQSLRWEGPLSVDITQEPQRLRQLFSHFRNIHLTHNALDTQGMYELLTTAHYPHLRGLSFDHQEVSTNAFVLLCQASWFRQLEHLSFAGNPCSEDALRRWQQGAPTQHLRALNLTQTGLTTEHLPLLLESLSQSPLQSLKLGHNHLGQEGAAMLAHTPALRTLRYLDLSCTALDNEGFTTIAQAPTLQRLTALHLNQNKLTTQGLTTLWQHQALPRLRHLRLNDNELSEYAIKHLAMAPCAPHLTDLGWGGGQLGRKGLRALLQLPCCQHLEVLDLSNNDLDCEDIIAMCQKGRFPKLHTLDLRSNRLGPTSVRALAASRRLPRLRRLNLSQNPLTDKALPWLAPSLTPPSYAQLDLFPTRAQHHPSPPGLRRLETLHLDFCQISWPSLLEVREKPGLAGIRDLGKMAFLHPDLQLPEEERDETSPPAPDEYSLRQDIGSHCYLLELADCPWLVGMRTIPTITWQQQLQILHNPHLPTKSKTNVLAAWQQQEWRRPTHRLESQQWLAMYLREAASATPKQTNALALAWWSLRVLEAQAPIRPILDVLEAMQCLLQSKHHFLQQDILQNFPFMRLRQHQHRTQKQLLEDALFS